MIISKEDGIKIRNKFKDVRDENYNITYLTVIAPLNVITREGETEYLGEEKLLDIIKQHDCVLVIQKYFNPNLFYKINRLCVDLEKKFVISYLDGDEGLIIPIMDINRAGCYNDFELLRESSFYNLLDYQIMKESYIKENNVLIASDNLYFNTLLNLTMLILDKYLKCTYINNYAYSVDFERMVITKIRLFRFPKCPSCQGDKNLTHPFI
ncbi:hypothetical protein Tmath_0473 [Thermoanaerobacter mathranii subsp. mathranii str. A3]|uniref:Uncharacterized protein n=2 Tax=Thermoanaerobacter TaxID=1754 RepID=A0A097AP48_THEKI|nr:MULTISPECIES: hypothetical protein [Thermoanaerobacter]ADH60237.1 hypothetical protein Tmath_0473 [Thermoanaerobacter mathranii subsp. mathranii str. A3]AIS51581.1 hypothetical protein TKV_c03770 [Thermoanaerobacter kivui]